MLAHVSVGELTALLVAAGGVLTYLWKISQAVNSFKQEHNELMKDLQSRSKNIEHKVEVKNGEAQ